MPRRIVYCTAILVALTLALFGCEAERATIVTGHSWAPSDERLIADLHSHTRFSDGALQLAELVDRAADNGCDVIAITDHSDQSRTAATPEYFAEAELANKRYPNLIVMAAMEWNMPPYNGREHVNVFVKPPLNETVLPELKANFDGDRTATEALTWLRSKLNSESDAALFYNHPSRRDGKRGENLTDMQSWRAVNKLVVGFEGGPGYQKRLKHIGGYTARQRTEDRWDPVVARIGGTWDALLNAGEDVWGAYAISDFHNSKSGYYPCEFARIHLSVPERSPAGVIDSLRAGAFWADHGRILDRLDLRVTALDLARPAVPGEVIAVPADQSVGVSVDVVRGPTEFHTPLELEVISNCENGKPRQLFAQTIAPQQYTVEFPIHKPVRGADHASCYVRARVRKRVEKRPDLMAYTNPIRIMVGKSVSMPAMSDPRALLGIAAVVGMLAIAAFTAFTWRGRTGRAAQSAQHVRVRTDAASYHHKSRQTATSIATTDGVRSLELGLVGDRSLTVPYENVFGCRLELNGEVVASASREQEPPSSDELARMSEVLLAEQARPLRDNATRTINIDIDYVANAPWTHSLNFYYRDGRRRLTSMSYNESVEEALGWYCFLAFDVLAPRAQSVAVSEAAPEPSVGEPRGALEEPPQDAAPNDLVAQLDRLAQLRQRGVISEEEFRKAKAKLLGS